jgi:hypothetical protein
MAMSLLLTGSRDQALLSMAVQEANEQSCGEGCYVGRRALQQIMYFLKAVDVPMSYRFDINHSRPYCDELDRDLEWLTADDVIADRSDHPSSYSNYVPAPSIDELLSAHALAMERFRPTVRRLVRALVPLRSERLALIASLDYIYRFQKASGGTGPWKSSVTSRLLQVKSDRFLPDEVSRTYDALTQVGLLDP